MIDFIKMQFDKVLIAGLIIYFITMQGLMLLHFPNIDGATLQWIEKSSDILLGALVALIIGGNKTSRGEEK